MKRGFLWSLFFNHVILLASFCLTANAQEIENEYLDETNFDFFFDVYRRPSELYELPNAFLRLDNPSRHCLKIQLSYSEKDRSILEVESRFSCSKEIFIGRNHIQDNLLKHWSHHSPQQYNLEIKLIDEANSFFSKQMTVGIVDYRVYKKDLMVNNYRESLKSVVINDSIDFSTTILLKKAHVNTLVFKSIPSVELVGIADSVGLYVIVDLSEINNSEKTRRKLNNLKNHPSIAYFLIKSSGFEELLKKSFRSIPFGTSYPKNLRSIHLDENTLESIRKVYQPFSSSMSFICSNEQQGYFIKVDNNNHHFNFWDKTTVRCELSDPIVGVSDTSYVRLKNNPLFFFERECHPDHAIDYKILILATLPFSVFSKNDTVAYFTKQSSK